MSTFTVKSSTVKVEISKLHFFVLCKGLNSGKPIAEKCPNSFIIQTETKEFKETLYWITFALWKSKAFHPFLMGSVIPFIRIGIYKQIISEHLQIVKANPEEFAKTLKQLNYIETKEVQLTQNLKLIQQLKRAYIYNYFNKLKTKI